MTTDQALRPSDANRPNRQTPTEIINRRIRRVVQHAQRQENERRAHQRFPRFCSATLRFDNQDLPAYVRDISIGGIGLIHTEPVAVNETVAVLLEVNGKMVRLRARICWCQRRDEAWHASGGELLSDTSNLQDLIGP